MNTLESWQNWKLNKELHIAGSFIYDSIELLHKMKYLNHEDECFDFLYKISVGLERLLKIALVLQEASNLGSQEELIAFEKSLITHVHLVLVDKLKQKNNVFDFDDRVNSFLQELGEFYKTIRYIRFQHDSVFHDQSARRSVLMLLEKYNIVTLPENIDYFPIRNSAKIRRFFQKRIEKICNHTYQAIENKAQDLNIYTYEIRSDSKAFKIFVAKEFSFEKEDICSLEVLIYLLSLEKTHEIKQYIEEIEALNLGFEELFSYVHGINNYLDMQYLRGEIEEVYAEDVKNKNDRIRKIKSFGGLPYFFYELNEDD